MNLSGKTSKLLALKESAEAELNSRFAEIFEAYRAVAFLDRRDQLFKEHWTPQLAASGYSFSGFEVCEGAVVLHGTELACGFQYHISISFPQALLDKPAAIRAHFQQKYKDAADCKQSDNAEGPSAPDLPAEAAS